MERPRNGRTPNFRGALVLGGLLVAILASAIVISLRIYSELDRGQRLQSVLFDAQQQLDLILRTQLDEETGLRGYLATGRMTLFLDPYVRRSETFEAAANSFATTTRGLDVPGLPRLVADMRMLHTRWQNDVARPLLADPHAGQALERQTLGKTYVDRLRSDVAHVHRLLEARLNAAEEALKRRIDEALVTGLSSVVVFAAVSIAYVLSRAQMLGLIDREREIVELLQGAFRTEPDALPGSRVGTAYLSADLDSAIGGDLYDIRRLDAERGLILVADVSGKGIQAAVNTAFIKYTIRTLAASYDDPAAILARFNRLFLDTVEDPNLFVVVFVGILDAAAGTLTYASAGHGAAYLRRGDAVRQLEVTGPIVGLDARFAYESRTLALVAGDVVLLATDGLTEARTDDGQFLDDAGAMKLLRRTSTEPQLCADELVARVRQMNRGSVRDDLALVVIAFDANAVLAA
ncbi:MAG: SpoIIE family protein phosphatase [Candidatus Eremiobacteraeota bacterium]|nr:SpoIIE family protein phosphatase [Candidatus Eremiobacteraeota bacterium]